MPYAPPTAAGDAPPTEARHSPAAPARGKLPGVRVMIAGGGTGGHLFPGVALAEQVRAEGGEVRFVGTARGIEARVLPGEGWALDLVDVVGIKGRGLRGLLTGLLRLPGAWAQSRRLIRAFAPDVVVGVGGYASGPVVATAACMGLPTAILEQNSVPGITNRILARLVRRVFTTFPDEARRFPARKVVLTGNPIRAELLARLQAAAEGTADAGGGAHGDADRARPPRLFVFGGSQGARALNQGMVDALPALLERLPGLEIWHQTGSAMVEELRAAYAKAGLGERARVDGFIRDMSEPYAWCDLVLCRAGATSLAELAAVGCPALLVPFPHATDNHQEHNARSLVDAGAAELVRESQMEPGVLADRLGTLLGDRDRLARMSAAMRDAARPEAAAEIYAALAGMAGMAGKREKSEITGS